MNTTTDSTASGAPDPIRPTIRIFAVGHNMPGCLPDDADSVTRHATFSDAVDALRELLDGWAEDDATADAEDAELDPDNVDTDDTDGLPPAESAIAELDAILRDTPDDILQADGLTVHYCPAACERVAWIEVVDPEDTDEAIRAAVAVHAGVSLSDVEYDPDGGSWGLGYVDAGAEEYHVAVGHRRHDIDDGRLIHWTADDAADAAASHAIADSLWAFVPEFLESYVPDGIGAEHIATIVGDRCEDANEVVRALVDADGPESFARLVRHAIAADGRGHFLAPHDFEEVELEGIPIEGIEGGTTVYLYRV